MKTVKDFSKSYVFLSVLYIAVGILLLAWPAPSIRAIGNGLGIVMAVLGVTYLLLFITKERQEKFFQMELVIGIVCLAAGVFILLTPEFLTMALPLAMGVVLLLGSIVKIQNAISMKHLNFKRWYLVLVCALVIIGLGIFLICNLFRTEQQMLLYIGACLILDGFVNLVSLICIQLRMKHLSRLQRQYPDRKPEELLGADRDDSVVDEPSEPAPGGRARARQKKAAGKAPKRKFGFHFPGKKTGAAASDGEETDQAQEPTAQAGEEDSLQAVVPVTNAAQGPDGELAVIVTAGETARDVSAAGPASEAAEADTGKTGE